MEIDDEGQVIGNVGDGRLRHDCDPLNETVGSAPDLHVRALFAFATTALIPATIPCACKERSAGTAVLRHRRVEQACLVEVARDEEAWTDARRAIASKMMSSAHVCSPRAIRRSSFIGDGSGMIQNVRNSFACRAGACTDARTIGASAKSIAASAT